MLKIGTLIFVFFPWLYTSVLLLWKRWHNSFRKVVECALGCASIAQMIFCGAEVNQSEDVIRSSVISIYWWWRAAASQWEKIGVSDKELSQPCKKQLICAPNTKFPFSKEAAMFHCCFRPAVSCSYNSCTALLEYSICWAQGNRMIGYVVKPGTAALPRPAARLWVLAAGRAAPASHPTATAAIGPSNTQPHHARSDTRTGKTRSRTRNSLWAFPLVCAMKKRYPYL